MPVSNGRQHRSDAVISVNGVRPTTLAFACLKAFQSKPCGRHWPRGGTVTFRNGGGAEVVSWSSGPSGKALVYYNGVLVLPESADKLFDLVWQNEENKYYKEGSNAVEIPIGKLWVGPGLEVDVVRGSLSVKPCANGVSGGERLTELTNRLTHDRPLVDEDVVQFVNRLASKPHLNCARAVGFEQETRSKPFGTMIIDPPWPYRSVESDDEEVNARLGGYSVEQYKPLGIDDLASLPIRQLCDYVFLWTTPAFWADGWCHYLIRKWGLASPTCFFWVKGKVTGDPTDLHVAPNYKVGYWFRGAVEPFIVCKDPSAPSIRTNYVGLLGESVEHSRKPESVHRLAQDKFPGPYAELFARRVSSCPNWNYFGNGAPGDGADIRDTLGKIAQRWGSVRPKERL